jgi:hypothetical protein
VQTRNIRNRGLVVGGGGTLTVAVALVWFKSASPGPIYLWSLGIVALGWAVVLWQALVGAQRAANAEIDAAGRETRAVIDGVTQLTSEEIHEACEELMRVDELLAHAIEQLMAAFHSLGDRTSLHQGELARQTAAQEDTPAAECMQAAAERVAVDMDSAVTALQFRDVVGQKLGHVRSELLALEQAMRGIRLAATECPPEELALQIRALLQQLQQAKAASPARQELMHAGEVELF